MDDYFRYVYAVCRGSSHYIRVYQNPLMSGEMEYMRVAGENSISSIKLPVLY